jgi:hypothetical protein
LLNRIAGNSESLILGLLLCILVDNDRNIKWKYTLNAKPAKIRFIAKAILMSLRKKTAHWLYYL